MKRLSVIIPGYNIPQEYWHRCVKSVLSACGPNDEVYCVDDGSATHVQNEWFAGDDGQVDSRVHLLRLEKNSGLPAARNIAMKVATGEFVTFIDSDDEVLPGVYDDCLSALQRYDADIAIYGAYTIWLGTGQYMSVGGEERNFGKLNAESLAFICKNRLFDSACNKVYRVKFLNQHALKFEEDVRTGEDTVFNCACVVQDAKWCTVKSIAYVYYRYDGSMLSRYVPNMRATHLRKLQARAAARAACPGVDELLGGRVAISEEVLDAFEWRNMWFRGTPYSLSERWSYLKNHRHLCQGYILPSFIKLTVYWFLRRHFYIRVIRKWHAKRIFPEIRNIKESEIEQLGVAI